MNHLPEVLPALDYAPRWQRAFHACVDGAVSYFGGVAFVRLVLLLPAAEESLLPWLQEIQEAHRRLFPIFFLFLYYLVMEVGFRTTIGKMLTRTVLADADGLRPGRPRLLIRTLCRFIPFEALSFFDRNGKGVHDSFSRTYVVRHP